MAIDVRLVRCLLTQQFPRWADEPVRAVLPGSSDNGTFRAGTHPACDLVIAWSFLHGESRRAFRAALPSVDAGARARARGWAL